MNFNYPDRKDKILLGLSAAKIAIQATIKAFEDFTEALAAVELPINIKMLVYKAENEEDLRNKIRRLEMYHRRYERRKEEK